MYKNALVFALLLFGLSPSQAQNFTIQTSDTLIYGQTNENTFYGDIDLYNANDYNLNMTWENVYQDLPNGWEFSNCDNDACHPIGDLIGYFELDANAEGFINTHFYPNNIEGNGYVEVKIYESGYSDDFYTMTFWGETKTLNINKLSTMDIVVYPNPVNDQLNVRITGLIIEPVQLKIKNMFGQTLLTQLISSELNTLNVSRLAKGVYFLEISEGQTMKFFKK